MANRGCTVCITVLGGSSNGSENEDLSLPVALHSPLSVLKEQLEDLTDIATADQVLILCDLSDVERNNDKLLEGRDYMSLRECGIRNGAVMTLHALGMSAEKKQKMQKEAEKKKLADAVVEEAVREQDKKHQLHTRITAARADHSYNGVIFDVMCNGPFEVDLLSVSVGGMLGRVRIYARDGQWNEDQPSIHSSSNAWSQRGKSVNDAGWTLVADQTCRPSWDKPLEIKFDHPVTLLPHQRRGLYCHSSLPDDLGIQYQSYHSKDTVVAINEHITLLAGLGHTGSQPFDETRGWYRAWRGLSGTVSYRTKWKGWSPLQHKLFPTDLRDAVRSMLLCQNRVLLENGTDCTAGSSSSSATASSTAASSIAPSPSKISSPSPSKSPRSPIVTPRSPTGLPTAPMNTPMSPTTTFNMEQYGPTPYGNITPPPGFKDNSSLRSEEDEDREEIVPNPNLKLHLLPKYVIYNILEFMHWDWYLEVERMRAAEESDKISSLRADLLEGQGACAQAVTNRALTSLTQGLLSSLTNTTVMYSDDDDIYGDDDDYEDDEEDEDLDEDDDNEEEDEGEEGEERDEGFYTESLRIIDAALGRAPMDLMSDGSETSDSDSESSTYTSEDELGEQEGEGMGMGTVGVMTTGEGAGDTDSTSNSDSSEEDSDEEEGEDQGVPCHRNDENEGENEGENVLDHFPGVGGMEDESDDGGCNPNNDCQYGEEEGHEDPNYTEYY